MTLALLSLLTIKAHAQDADYLRIYETIQQADALATNNPAAALEKYQRAQAELTQIRQNDRTYKPDLISYRLNDLANKIAACNEKLQPAAATAGSSSTDRVQPAKSAKPSPEAVKVLDAGTEPRRVLRLEPQAGDKQTLILTTSMVMEPGPLTNFPAITETSQITVKSVSANGDIEFERVVSDVSMASGGPPALDPETLSKALSSLKGVTTSGVMSSRGASIREDVKYAASGKQQPPALARLVSGAVGSSLDGFIMLPEEAIGPGAKWEVTLAGKATVQKLLYELVSVEGSKISVKEAVTLSDQTQKAKGLGMKGKGTGELTIDLARFVPVRGTVSMVMEGTSPGMKVRTDIRMESK